MGHAARLNHNEWEGYRREVWAVRTSPRIHREGVDSSRPVRGAISIRRSLVARSRAGSEKLSDFGPDRFCEEAAGLDPAALDLAHDSLGGELHDANKLH